MVIPFTDREMERAWKQNKSASEAASRTNAHRLLLFYAVECGLKAILMRRQGKKGKNRTDLCPEISECQHDVNKLLDCLYAGKNLKLPTQLSMTNIQGKSGKSDERKFPPGELNQMWRYGGSSSSGGTDEQLEKQLLEIVEWIEGELKRP